jgi:hypothetical protein
MTLVATGARIETLARRLSTAPDRSCRISSRLLSLIGGMVSRGYHDPNAVAFASTPRPPHYITRWTFRPLAGFFHNSSLRKIRE